MSTEPITSTLLPVTVHLPGEIISMIAEACVESCSIQVRRHIESPDPVSSRFTVHFISPVSEPAVVSRDFQNGIQRGFRRNFNGHLTLPAGCVNRATEVLRDRDLVGVVLETSQLHLYYMEDFKTDDCEARDPAYVNVKNLTIACRTRGGHRQGAISLTWGYYDMFLLPAKARRVLREARPCVKTNAKAVVKFIRPTGLEGSISSYANIEIWLSENASTTFPAYETKSLDWMIRFPYALRE